MTTESTATNPLEFWKEMTQNWTEAWTKNGGSWPNFDTANMFNQFQSFSPFQQSDPYQVWQQVLKQYFDSWSEFWTKNLSGAASPDVSQRCAAEMDGATGNPGQLIFRGHEHRGLLQHAGQDHRARLDLAGQVLPGR